VSTIEVYPICNTVVTAVTSPTDPAHTSGLQLRRDGEAYVDFTLL